MTSSVRRQLFLSVVMVMELARCTAQPDVKAPITAQLVAKYQVLDEELSPHHVKCGGIVEEFLHAGPYTCSFKVQGMEFDIEKKYVIDSTGHLQEFRQYLAEGPLIYGPKELAEDSVFMRYEGLTNFHIALADDARSVLDGSDSIAIERIFPAEKLILARRSVHLTRGRRFIYQYQE